MNGLEVWQEQVSLVVSNLAFHRLLMERKNVSELSILIVTALTWDQEDGVSGETATPSHLWPTEKNQSRCLMDTKWHLSKADFLLSLSSLPSAHHKTPSFQFRLPASHVPLTPLSSFLPGAMLALCLESDLSYLCHFSFPYLFYFL